MGLKGARIHITGIVQGVGFRPFVYGLATRLALNGWVRNTSAGVDIEVDGSQEDLESFIAALRLEAPPLSRIDSFQVDWIPLKNFSTFEIIHSEGKAGDFIPISPDVSVCPDCLAELFDPLDRRYHYPFINCTNCGPRFTIIQDIPYDRPKTTMGQFEMCPACASEYENPLDRRFHAQPVACPDCGPHIWLETREARFGDESSPVEVIRETRRLIAQGAIIAIKGLGGFHLACDAENSEAVAELRRRKLRVDKPFALMMPEVNIVSRHCYLGETEKALLLSRQRPVVILERRPDSPIASQVAPNQGTLGVMLPYTPLHYLLMEHDEGFPQALVMTSGNLSEEPIATGNEEARLRLGELADAFLMHNRDIYIRCDDSVLRIFDPEQTGGLSLAENRSAELPLRRARGYAPDPLQLIWKMPPVLATGPELKNTFCLTRENYAFISHHIGDLENYETLRAFEEGILHYERLFRIHPQAIAYDLHPDYLATRYALARAKEQSLPAFGVQHHHAHIAACLAENDHPGDRPVIGLSLDGTGYGEDGAIWGGEILLADYLGFERPYHLAYIPLPGGDRAIREPWRVALAHLHQANIDWEADLPPIIYARNLSSQAGEPLNLLSKQITGQINAPPTSSMGRLFDAVSSLLGIRHTANYEAQAAIELEALADPDVTGSYPFIIEENILNPTAMFQELLADLRASISIATIAGRFHNTISDLLLCLCQEIRNRRSVGEVALSGGVWQNMVLLNKTTHLLQEDGFTVYLHHQVPTNDGGISLGQAVIAMNKLDI
ncbi:MAG: carbamoyltransferase HypF [Chloroflexota bacterium]|nr:MAG: carbamoyltransferase HypF [Chloroflexota bacterium]